MEKERYRLNIYDNHIADCYDNGVLVNSIITIYDVEKLLNQQDTKIKKLESQLRVSNSQCASSELRYKEFEKDYKKQEDLLKLYLKYNSELNLENQQLKQQLEEKEKEIGELSLYSERLYKLEARIGLEERTVGDVVEELDSLRNRLELSQKEYILLNQQLKQSQNQKAIEVLTDILVNLCSRYSTIFGNHDEPIRVLSVEQISDFINNRIEELKGL